MVSPYFKASDKVREFAKYVIIYSLASLFLNFFNVTLEKIPFTDLPIPQSRGLFSVSAVLTLLALYTWFQLLIQYATEFLDYDRAEEEAAFEEIKKGNFAQALPAAVQGQPALQEAFANLQDALRLTHAKIRMIGWIRILNELVLPTAVLALALYIDAANIAAFATTLQGFGALSFFLATIVALLAIIVATYLIDRTPLPLAVKWIVRVVVVAIAAGLLVRNFW